MKFLVRPGPHLRLTATLSPEAFRRLLLVVLVFWLVLAVCLYLGAEAAAARWAPAGGQQTSGLLVVFVWIGQIVPFLKRTRSLLGAVCDGLLYSIGLGTVLIAVIHFAG